MIFNGLVSEKNYLDQRNKCFYVLWLNSSTPNGLGHYEQRWGIGTRTDTIYSNLNISVINRIFPKFQGILIDGKISEVVIHENYNVNEWWFYQDIEFVGFNRFEDTYKLYKDSLNKSKQKFKNDN